jgi:DNA (cytosine-5)-methyltransferase 1
MQKRGKQTVYTFADLFAGIGGFHLAFHKLGGSCVFVSESDEHARKTYEHNFFKITPALFSSGNFAGDITKVDAKAIPDFDILTAGFPCQPFSQAGLRKGFNDTRGTLFFDIVRILKAKKPSAFFLENVRGLYSHDNGKTFALIKKTIEGLGYSFYYKIIKACEYGLPQYRPRLFMVGFRDKTIPFSFREPIKLKTSMSDIFGAPCSRNIGFTLRVSGRGTCINDRRNWDAYWVNEKVRRLTSKEGKRMMGFPEYFEFPVSETKAMQQLGNSVAVNAVEAVAKEIIIALRSYDMQKKQRCTACKKNKPPDRIN